MESLKLGGNKSSSLETGCHFYAYLFPALLLSLCTYSCKKKKKHLPYRSCVTLLQELLVAVFISSRSAAEKQL